MRTRVHLTKVMTENGQWVVGKMCTECGIDLPLTSFRTKKGGLGDKDSKCGHCKSKVEKTRRKEGKVKSRTREDRLINGVLVPGRKCSKCRQWKPYKDNYYLASTRASGYEPRCIECEKQRREDRRDYFRTYQAEWNQDNKSKKKLYSHRRRAMKKSLPDTLTEDEFSDILSHFNDACALTQRSPKTIKKLHVEHIIPLDWGHGGTAKGNIVPLMGSLNLSKQTKNIFTWFESVKDKKHLSQEAFDNLISYLAKMNDLTVSEYREFVFWCEAHKRTLEEVKADPRPSIEIWQEATGRKGA